MRKEPIKEVVKVWGEEIWMVNDIYCGKYLVIDRGATSSYHYHRTKQETFVCLEGYGILTVDGKEHHLAPFARAKTIMPGEKHKFHGITECILFEVSTHHDDEDVVRLEGSKKGE